MGSGVIGDVTKRGYIMSQFARFIRPGDLRIECDDNPQSGVYVSAYRDSSSSKVVIVAINTSSWFDRNQTFVFPDSGVDAFTHYVTSETQNCSQETDIYVINNSLNVTLGTESVTTLLSGSVVMVDEDPVSFKLYQNYPNPFCFSTAIKFGIPEKSFVSLKVYNLLGQEVAVIAEKEYSSGVHSVIFDASNLASGIYFYTLKAGDLIDTRRMHIIK
jgi:hypothetical protein